MKVACRIVLSFIASFLVLSLCSCLRNNSDLKEFGTWSFSGDVIDGASGKVLNGVEISYMDDAGEQQLDAVGKDGKYYIEGLPYGERTFVFTFSGLDSSYTSIRITVASWAEASSLGGVIGDISRIIRLYPLTGSVTGYLVYQPLGTDYHLPAAEASVRIVYLDSSMQNAEPSTFTVAADSSGYFEASGLPFAPGCIINYDNFIKKGITYSLAAETATLFSETVQDDLGKMVFTTTDSTLGGASMIMSNVLSSDGFGRTGVPVNQTIWYKLPIELESGSVSAQVNGFGPPSIDIRMSDDTLFLIPVVQLAYDTLVEVGVTGFTIDNESFKMNLDGSARFRTEKSPFPIEASFWSQPWITNGRFGIGQTLWIRFSEPLDTLLSVYNWAASSAGVTVYGSGSMANAAFSVSGDTLFVVPDQRLDFNYNSTIGLNIQCRAADGRYMQHFDFSSNTIEDPMYVVWTNTKDEMGKNRTDMGLRDTLKLVSSVSEFSVIGVSGSENGIEPPGLILSDVKVVGDTIMFLPSLSMESDTIYSVDFDLKLFDGTIRRDVLEMTWTTRKRVAIVATDTRVNGMYRPLAAIGDSFTVTFSEPIDTSAKAAVVFRVNIEDVNGVKKRNAVYWNDKCCTASIRVLDTLPTADFDAPAAYTANASATRAVESVTFDLVTMAGEQVLQCSPEGDPIELHTEKGLCVVTTSIVANLNGRIAVESDFSPLMEFPLDGVVELQFSRPLDTAAMNMDSLALYVGLHKAGAVIVPATVTLLKDLTTLRIDPDESLEMKTDYYVRIEKLPAHGIAGAAPVNRHGGTFSGMSGASYLLERPFRTQ